MAVAVGALVRVGSHLVRGAARPPALFSWRPRRPPTPPRRDLQTLCWMCFSISSVLRSSASRRTLGAASPEVYQACRSADGNATLPQLVAVQRWRSVRRQPQESITLVTQLSLDRCGYA